MTITFLFRSGLAGSLLSVLALYTSGSIMGAIRIAPGGMPMDVLKSTLTSDIPLVVAGNPRAFQHSTPSAVSTTGSMDDCQAGIHWIFPPDLPYGLLSQPTSFQDPSQTETDYSCQESGLGTDIEAISMVLTDFQHANDRVRTAIARYIPPLHAGGSMASKSLSDCEDINAATAEALQRVRGIGAAKARDIITFREQHGPFGSLDELASVRGIGPATIENFRAAGFCVSGEAHEVAAEPVGTDDSEATTVDSEPECIDINTAGVDQLQIVSGIGSAKAQAVIAFREQFGPFGSLDELTSVRGIGPSTVENFRRASFCDAGSTAAIDNSGYDLPQAVGTASLASGNGCVDINTADAAALERVSGVGPPKIKAIMAYHDSVGAFSSMDVLSEVQGIGPTTLDNFRKASFCVGGSVDEVVTAGLSPPFSGSIPDSLTLPYDRRLYGGWGDEDGDCQNTRTEVLIAESLVEVSMDDEGCRVIAGEWLDPYTGIVITDPSKLDVDHFIPLAEVHRSGAAAWDSTRRHVFANNLQQSGALIAVSASTNRSKGDRDPADWLPPNEAYHCKYVKDWIDYKAAWQLTLDANESRVVAEILTRCLSDTEVPVPSTLPEEDASPPTEPARCSDINSAEAGRLLSIDGLSTQKLDRLQDHIRENGPFKSLSEVTIVRGFGPKLLENLRSAGFCETIGEPR